MSVMPPLILMTIAKLVDHPLSQIGEIAYRFGDLIFPEKAFKGHCVATPHPNLIALDILSEIHNDFLHEFNLVCIHNMRKV